MSPKVSLKTKSNPKAILEDWVIEKLADPITKNHLPVKLFKKVNGIIDARVYLKNTHGFNKWQIGQNEYELWSTSGEGYDNQLKSYLKEIEYDRPVYQHFKMDKYILDVGGLVGTVREFLNEDCKFVSVDPFLEAIDNIPKSMKDAYKCLSKPLNFIGALAEFLPFQSNSFD